MSSVQERKGVPADVDIAESDGQTLSRKYAKAVSTDTLAVILPYGLTRYAYLGLSVP